MESTNTSLSPCPGVVRTSEAAILPYVPYPTCLATGSPPATHLPVLQPRRTSQLGALMTDPATGIEVPVLAVTLHPQTRQWLTLGGTYCNPLTKTLAPLELGGPMEDPVTGSISPILGVGLDENTGVCGPQCCAPTFSSLPSLASQSPQPPNRPCSGPGCKPPQTHLSTLYPHSALTPPVFSVPASPSPSPSPAQCVGEKKETQAGSSVKAEECFQPRRGIPPPATTVATPGPSPSPLTLPSPDFWSPTSFTHKVCRP